MKKNITMTLLLLLAITTTSFAKNEDFGIGIGAFGTTVKEKEKEGLLITIEYLLNWTKFSLGYAEGRNKHSIIGYYYADKRKYGPAIGIMHQGEELQVLVGGHYKFYSHQGLEISIKALTNKAFQLKGFGVNFIWKI